MFRKLLLIALIAGLVVPMIGCSEDDPPPPKKDPPFGPAAIAVGEDSGGTPEIMLTGDMLTWTAATGNAITGATDFIKVVRTPLTGRLVMIVRMGAGEHDTIWYNETGGDGAWTQASFDDAATEDRLDPEHRTATAGSWSDWQLNDIFFVNDTDGFAVGDNFIILWTWDGGATWADLNSYHNADGTTERWYIDNVVVTPMAGDAIGNDGTTPTATATVVSYEQTGADYGYLIVTDIDETAGTWNHGTDQIFVGATLYADTWTMNDDTIWKYDTSWGTDTGGLESVFMLEDSTTNIQTIWMGTSTSNSLTGIWTITSDGTTGATRTFPTWEYPPLVTQEYNSYAIGDYDVKALYYFDTSTGFVGTGYGVYAFTSGTYSATVDAVADNQVQAFVWSAETMDMTGHLYTIKYGASYGSPIRVEVVWAAGPTWTPGTWQEHGDPSPGFVGLDYMDYGPNSMFKWGGNIYALGTSWSYGYIGWGQAVCDAGNLQADFDATYWQDSSEMYMGDDTTTMTPNPNYNMDISATAASYNSMIKLE